MPVIYWSGGLDSTVLLYDLALHPYRYGHTDDEPLEVLVIASDTTHKERITTPILGDLRERVKWRQDHGYSALSPNLSFVDDGLFCRKSAPPMKGGVQSTQPGLTHFMPDVLLASFTYGWTIWQGVFGMNWILEKDPIDETSEWRRRKIYLGHQQDRPWWQQYDRNELPYTSDLSPEYVRKVNVLLDVEGVEMACPFMDTRMAKVDIVQMGIEVGVPLEKTYSCMRGGPVECGVCSSCLRVTAIFRDLGLPSKMYEDRSKEPAKRGAKRGRR